MFKNKHLILAMLIAPVLAVIATLVSTLPSVKNPMPQKKGKLTNWLRAQTAVTPPGFVTWKTVTLKSSSVLSP